MASRTLRPRRASEDDGTSSEQLRQRVAELESRLAGTSAANAGNV